MKTLVSIIVVIVMTAAAALCVGGCKGTGSSGDDKAAANIKDRVDTALTGTQENNADSARIGRLEITRKDYEYQKPGADFKFHLENAGNSDKIHNLINKLMYRGMDFDEYVKYSENDFIKGNSDGDGKVGTEWGNYSMDQSYSIICNSDAQIIFELNESYYLGGAHGSYSTAYTVIDLIDEKILAIGDFIRPVPDDLLDRLIKSDNTHLADMDSYFRDNLWPPDGINFCGENIKFLWNQYTIASYADGQIWIELQDSVSSRYLTDKGKAFRKNNRQVKEPVSDGF